MERHLKWMLLPRGNGSDAASGCGLDFLATENGFSEFTHPDCNQMLRWINMTTVYTKKLGKVHFLHAMPDTTAVRTHLRPNAGYLSNQQEAFIKCHCSAGQVCNDYKDPFTGKPINFNFLPYYANTELGIYPHKDRTCSHLREY